MKKKMEPGPLVAAIDESRNSISRRHALMQYSQNLEHGSAYARAWRHGGYLFMALLILFFCMSLASIWRPIPGAGLLPWATSATSFLSTYMFGRSSRLLRRAIAGYPARPS